VAAWERPPNRRLHAVGAAACWLGAGIGYLVAEAVVAAAFRPEYSYVHDYISDLGRAIDSPLSPLMNFAFCLQGTGFLAGAVFAGRASGGRNLGLFVTLATANALGNILVGAFHSGSLAEADGTVWVHRAGAVLAIVAGNCAILAGSRILRNAGAARWYRGTSVGLAVVGLLSLAILVAVSTAGALLVLPEAVWERGSVYSIVGWQMFTAGYLLRRTTNTTSLGTR
jgi:hypothetical membrane protein